MSEAENVDHSSLQEGASQQYQSFRLSKGDYKTWSRKTSRRADLWLTVTLIVGVLISTVFAGKYDTWFSVLYCALGLAVYGCFRGFAYRKPWHRYVGSGVLAAFCAVYIHQLNGLDQTYFFVFVGAVILIAFRNPKIFLPFAIVTVITQSTMAWLQYDGSEVVVFARDPDGYMGVYDFIMHMGLNAVIIALCAQWSKRLRKAGLEGYRAKKFLEQQMRMVEANINLAQAISEGKVEEKSTEVTQDIDENDSLRTALINMQSSLREAREKEKQENFINLGLARVGEVLRDYDQDFNGLSSRLVSTLVNYYDANQGGLFVLEEGENPEYLELVAFYAYERNKYTDRKVKIGEGLVGQVFRTGKVLHLREIPEGYITVTSGLGHAPPDSLVLVPLTLNEVTYGVIEMASFHAFEDYQIDLLRKLAENIASSLANLRNSAYTHKLLDESQQLAEMMRSQEEEMRQNMEELQATQEEMARKEKQREVEIGQLQEEYEMVISDLEKATIDLQTEVQNLTQEAEKERNDKKELAAEVEALKEQLRSGN